MTELSGTLEGVGLPAIVRFLAGLHKTGALRVTNQDWHGDVFFDAGRVISAQLGSRQGLTALDALVQALPGGAFVFDVEAKAPETPNVELSHEALLAHLEDLATRTASGGPVLPSLESVPRLTPQIEDATDEDTVPLDRGTLQTLLQIDGHRTVREIIGVRGSFDALWQIANLAEVGLVSITAPHAAPKAASASAPAATPMTVREERKSTPPPPRTPTPTRATRTAEVREPKRPEPRPLAVQPSAVQPSVVQPSVVQPVAPPSVAPRPEPQRPTPVVPLTTGPSTALTSCPKLGFEDDPSSSFARPTRLHRCFAAGTPLPLSLDQQRELCLSEQYGTCPRLAMAGLAPSALEAATIVTPAAPLSAVEQSVAEPQVPLADDPRIVRLPVGGRARPAAHVASPIETTPGPSQPTPLRARPIRSGLGAATVIDEPVATPAGEPKVESAPPAPPRRPNVATAAIEATPPRRLLGNLPPGALAAAAVVVIVIAVVSALLVPRLGDLFTDEQGVDLSSLPNASAVIAGTPVSELPAPRPTVAADAAAPATGATGATGAVGATGAAEAPAPAPTAAARVVPTSAPPAAPTVVPTPAGPRTLLDESFDDNSRNWPNNPQGVAWVTGGTLRIAPRQAGQFVALAVPPVGEILQDVTVSGTFRKVGGPAGGGYGIIVRDQGPGPRDGANQAGRYYVLEVGDKGEVGIWRREGDRWIDLLPWQRADAVRPGTAANELTVKVSGDRLSLTVNGTEVGFRNDGTLAVGNIGIFVGGDGNQVALEHLTVKTP